jgi:hypothetical protein
VISVLAWIALALAAIPALLFMKNLGLYRAPQAPASSREKSRISVLIPARDEESNIRAAIASALSNEDVDLEVIVLDDHSADDTARIVAEIAMQDARVRLEAAPALPAGWCGKQHACWVLANLARNPALVFMDADVRLAPDALSRMHAFLRESGASLASGVPLQLTGTFLERLLIPLIHFVLLGFLPLDRMRQDRRAAFGAGCGQLFIADREAYMATGGHRQIRESLHDGIRLPRAFREHGYHTDLFDATDLATCRMYTGLLQTWRGLGKNATEGMGSPKLIGPFTFLLFGGQILPWLLLAVAPASVAVLLAVFASLAPRVVAAVRFQQSWMSVFLHPLGVALLLLIQWQALLARMSGRIPTWRGRQVAPGL